LILNSLNLIQSLMSYYKKRQGQVSPGQFHFLRNIFLHKMHSESLPPSLGASPPTRQSSMTKLAKKATATTTVQFVPNGGIGATELVEMETTEMYEIPQREHFYYCFSEKVPLGWVYK
jgi:hypothetical protein